MSVLIKGITKPTDCILCPMFRGAWQMCGLLNREVYPKGTPKNCPLVELPPHGRLIDADALMKDGWVLHKQVMRMGGYAIHEMPLNYPTIPTVIGAEEVEE